MVNGVVQAWQPIIETIRYKVRCCPQDPDDHRSVQESRAENLHPPAALRGSSYTCRYVLYGTGLGLTPGLDLLDDELGLIDSSFRNQPPGRLRQTQEEPCNDQPRNSANQKHGLPSEGRNDPRADLTCGHQSNRENQFVQHEEFPAA